MPAEGTNSSPECLPVRFDGLLERSGSSRRDSFVSNNFLSFFFVPLSYLYSVSFIDSREMLDCYICDGRFIDHESM